MGKRALENRIESAEQSHSPDDSSHAPMLDELDEEYGDGAGLEALAELIRWMFAIDNDDWSGLPSPLSESSHFETTEERNQHVAALSEDIFRSDAANGDSAPHPPDWDRRRREAS